MSTACQAKRARRKARIDPRYAPTKKKDAAVRAQRMKRVLEREQERRNRGSKKS